MSKKDKPLALILAIFMTLGIFGVGMWLLSKTGIFGIITNNPVSNPTKKGQITLLGDTFSGYSTFRNAEFQQTLKDLGITLTYQDEFDQTKRADLLNQGKADLYVTTLDQFLKHQPKGKIVGLIDRTIGADAVVLNSKKYPQLKSLRELNQLVSSQGANQLKISYAVDTPSEYLALVLSTSFEDFNLSDFQVKEVADASEAWQNLQDNNQNIAVAILWEPFVTQARKQSYTVVLSSKDAPTAILDVIVASDHLLTSQPELITNFLETYYRHIDANIRDSSQLKKQIAEDGNLSTEDTTAVLTGIDFFTSIEAKNWLSDGTLEKRIGATAAVLALSGKINQVPTNIPELFATEYINKAASNTQTLIDLVKLDNPKLAKRLTGEGSTIPQTPNISQSQIENAPDIGNLDIRGDVKFDTGSANLTQESQQTLTQLAEKIKEFNPQTVAIRVIGHTSKTGSAQLNQVLSQQRAEVVVNALRQRGLKYNISAEGKGFNVPLSGISPEDSRQQRTEIRLVRISQN